MTDLHDYGITKLDGYRSTQLQEYYAGLRLDPWLMRGSPATLPPAISRTALAHDHVDEPQANKRSIFTTTFYSDLYAVIHDLLLEKSLSISPLSPLTVYT